MSVLLILFLITLLLAMISGLIFLSASIPTQYIKIHMYIIVLPIIVGLIGLFTVNNPIIIGPFTLDKLAWLMGSFILILGLLYKSFVYVICLVIKLSTILSAVYTHHCICVCRLVKWGSKTNGFKLGRNVVVSDFIN